MVGRASRAALLAILLSALTASPSRAQAPTSDPSSGEASEAAPEQPRTCPRARRLAAPLLALLAGPIVHGSGHFTACEPRTARRLLMAEGIGLGAFLIGGGGLAATGASRKTVAPFSILLTAGVGTFLTSWLSDIYGAVSGRDAMGRPAPLAPFELAAGYRYIHDPQFDYGSALRLGAEGRLGGTRLFGGAWLAADDDNQRVRAGIAQRLLGEGRGAFVELEGAVAYHRFGSDGFQSLTTELQLRGRLDLVRIGPTLAGSFVELDLGFGMQGFGYDATGRGVSQDYNGMLLARVGYGLFVGPSGEVVAYYDHRRDDYAGGLSVDSVAAGTLGHVGVAGRGFFDDGPWGLSAELEYGAAVIVGASLVYRGGARDPSAGAEEGSE